MTFRCSRILHLSHAILLLLLVLGSGVSFYAQSVLGSISGTVRDSSGGGIPNAKIVLHRTETNTDRTVTTDGSGNYNAINIDAGVYDVTTSAGGFSDNLAKGLPLLARQQVQYDVILTVTANKETVTVNATDAGVIQTENAQVSAALSPREVLDLPANYRGAGSTSPINVVQTLPGVQPDTAAYPPAPSTHPSPALRFSIQGGLPSQTETTVDGISAQNQTNNNIQGDAFPSAESIAEIRIDGVNNNAEYGQPGEITTITKSGANKLHGSIYEYHQNQFLDATPYGTNAANKPHKIANDFGGSFGGPVVIPHLYNGRDRTFIFGAYEGLRYPQSNVLHALVPTTLMKQGDFSQETSTPLINPFTGAPYPGNKVPINASSAPFLALYPNPSPQFANESLQQAFATTGYNYLGTRRDDISSNQFDVRGDQDLRSTRNNIWSLHVQERQSSGASRSCAAEWHFVCALSHLCQQLQLCPHAAPVANEVRFGFTLEEDGNANPFDGQAFTVGTGLHVLQTPAFFNGLPHLQFNDGKITSIGSRLGFVEKSRIFQYVDNLTWQLGSLIPFASVAMSGTWSPTRKRAARPHRSTMAISPSTLPTPRPAMNLRIS